MMQADHYSALCRMYLEAPIQTLYPGITISVKEGAAEIQLPVRPEYFHSAQGIHGSVYFKLLDDAAYFAAASLLRDYFLLTMEFNIRLLKKVDAGQLTAMGVCSSAQGKLIRAEARLINDSGELAAIGSGIFSRSKIPLDAGTGYRL